MATPPDGPSDAPPVDRFVAFVAAAPATEPIFFYHLPKTGGTSVEGALTAIAVARRRTLRIVSEAVGMSDRMPAAEPSPDPSAIAIAGHCLFGFHARLPAAVRLCTVIRDPIERIASDYMWRRRHAGAARSSADFRDWLDRDAELDLMTRMMAGPGPGGDVRLDRAVANLGRVALVGSTDRIADLITVLLSLYGGPSVEMERPKHEPAPLRHAIVEEFRDLVADRNPLDMVLRERMRPRFDELAALRLQLRGPVAPAVTVTNLRGKLFSVQPLAR